MALKDLWGRIAGKKDVGMPDPAPSGAPALDAGQEPDPAARMPAAAAERVGFLGRLRAGLSRSAAKLTENLGALFTRRKLDDAALEELEETLIAADLGLAASRRIVERFRKTRFGRDVTGAEIREALAEEIAAILAPVAKPLVPDPARAPFTLLMVGVNGTGKTTTIGKLGAQWTAEGHRVAFAAGDTFRAAAVEQLQVWGARTGCPVHAPEKDGADAAGLAFDALRAAKQDGTGILLIDTAGRLHNKSALMEELRKILRVLRRVDESAPHAVVLTLDATTGQNAIQQVKVFREMVEVSGLVVTKLDGSAKGGVVVALAEEFGLPVHAVGVGEKAEDLRPFDPREFARSLVGLDA
jgi:fused signal recognition particle receptor